MLKWFELVVAAAIVAATMPLLLELILSCVGGLLPGRDSRRQQAALFEGHIAILIPAHNEEQLVGRTVASILAAVAGDPLHASDVAVVAHNCTDGTEERARAAGARVIAGSWPAGKGHALQAGIAHALAAGAAAIAVVDADSTVTPNFVDALRLGLANADAVQCRYELDYPVASRYGIRAQLAGLGFRGMNVVRPLGRSSMGFSSGIFGNGFAVRAESLLAVPWRAFGIAEDLEYHTQLALAGRRTAFAEDATVWGTAASGHSAERAQRLRWEGGRLGVARRYVPRALTALCRGRIQAAETLADLLSLPLATASLLLVAGAAMGAALQMFWLQCYALAGLGVTAAYVAMAVRLSPKPLRAALALAAAPVFIFRKLWLLPATLRSSGRNAAWVRTERAAARSTAAEVKP